MKKPSKISRGQKSKVGAIPTLDCSLHLLSPPQQEARYWYATDVYDAFKKYCLIPTNDE